MLENFTKTLPRNETHRGQGKQAEQCIVWRKAKTSKEERIRK
jgi:hypothetical protein